MATADRRAAHPVVVLALLGVTNLPGVFDGGANALFTAVSHLSFAAFGLGLLVASIVFGCSHNVCYV